MAQRRFLWCCDDKYDFVTDKKSPYLVKKRGTIIVPEYVQEDSTVTFWFNFYENDIKNRIGVKGSSLWVLSMPLLIKNNPNLAPLISELMKI
jgi:hypothetical protein